VPGKFVAGGVYDPVEDEIIEGATLRLADASGGEVRVAETDGFGDFWFEDLPVAEYALTIEAEGFRVETVETIRTDADVNLGDIALTAEGVRA